MKNNFHYQKHIARTSGLGESGVKPTGGIVATFCLFVLMFFSCSSSSPKFPQGIQHVIVIGIDGMSPDGIQNANTPVLDEMMKNGAYTFAARAVLPSSSSSNWASILMGADTEQHGITSNSWERNEFVLPPVVSGPEGIFPTIFEVIRAQKPDAHIGAIYDWKGFGRLFEKSLVDFDLDTEGEDETTRVAAEYIKEHRPLFTFIHIDHVDGAGHGAGHKTQPYYRAVEKADTLIGMLVQAVKDAGIFNETVFLICSDHGGIGYGHGGETPAEMDIPFILYGAGVKQGYLIEEAVYQFDNAATVAFMFGLETPQAWIGRPVRGAFKGFEKPILHYRPAGHFAKPKIFPDNGPKALPGGLFIDKSATLKMQNPNNEGEIYFTLDGSAPSTENGMQYENEISINTTTVVKSAVFVNGKMKSSIATGFFRMTKSGQGNGAQYQFFHLDEIKMLPDFSALTPVSQGTVYEFSSDELAELKERNERVALRFTAFLQIDSPGRYEFFTNSDDGSQLFIGDRLIVDNDGDHSVRERSGMLELAAGLHPITVTWFNGGGGYHLDAQYAGPGLPKQIIRADRLFLKEKNL